VTELAVELNAPISTEEFQTLNRLLDVAIADAVTEHARLTAESSIAEELERSGMVAHEVRGMLNTALFAYEALKQGTVAINGSTGTMLGRSLMNLCNFVDSTLAVVRVDGHHERRQRILVTALINEIVLANRLQAESRGLLFTIEPIDPQLVIEVDPQLLTTAVTNLLNNAFKYTPDHGRVTLRTFSVDERLRIEVEDQCGGLPERVADPAMPSAERRGRDRSGLGLGLSIARKVVKAQGGDIHTRNIRGKGCVFVIEVPLAIDVTAAAAVTSDTSAR
jgi:signal transduction histidine kinase